MLYKVFDFADKEVSDVMVPRPEVVAISIALPAEEALKAVLESPYTRYPVYRETLDDIVGVLHIRDLIEAMHDRGISLVDVESLVRPAYMVPETKDLGALLTEFRRTNQHLAVVIDEYGSMEGIVTLEDLLEEIVGEIEDEFDLPDETVERVDDDTIRIDGTFPIDDFNERFGCDLPQEDYHTVAGFVFGELGRAAEPGDEVAARRPALPRRLRRRPADRPADRHVPAVAPSRRAPRRRRRARRLALEGQESGVEVPVALVAVLVGGDPHRVGLEPVPDANAACDCVVRVVEHVCAHAREERRPERRAFFGHGALERQPEHRRDDSKPELASRSAARDAPDLGLDAELA